MYRCETCGVVMWGKPSKQVCNFQLDGFREYGFDESCPYCESPHVSPYDPYGKEDDADE